MRVTASTARRAKRRVLGGRADLAQQHRVAGEAEDVADALTLAPRHDLGPSEMTVAARHDVDRRPAGADMAYYTAQHHLTSPPSGVLPGRRMIATRLPVVAS